jgi:hypothetical protein
MTNKIFFLVLAFICLILYVISLIVNKLKHKKEGFTDAPTRPSGTPTSGTSTPSSTPSSSPSPSPNVVCQQVPFPNWWDNKSPTQIIALTSGLRFPVIAVNSDSGLNSNFQIPIIKSGESMISGCVSINDNGTYVSSMCNKESTNQLWRIKYISNQTDFMSVLNVNPNNYSTGINRNNTSIVLPLGVQYGFFMIVSVFNPSLALANNAGSLTVQTVGNFVSQFWDITNEPGQSDIAIYKTNEFTNLETNYDNSVAVAGSRSPLMPLNADASSIYRATGQGANAGPNQTNRDTYGRQINLNINLSSDGVSLGVPSGTSSRNTTEQFAEASDCPVCPSILTDYIAKKNIPCYGCTL